MTKFKWQRVSADVPCPICKKFDYCRVSSDGALAGCMRVELGAFKTKDGSDGSRVYLHRLADGPRPSELSLPNPAPEAKRADADTLHAVYSAFLERLKLSEAHREALQRRKLTDDAIDRAGYRTLPVHGRSRLARDLRDLFGDKLLRVPGFVVKEGKSGRYLTVSGSAGLLVPCRDRSGRILGLKVRRDDAADGGRRYSYCSSTGHGGPGPGSPVHVPTGTPEKTDLVRLTEGELKADVIQELSGLPTVSVPGVSSWRQAWPVLKELNCKTVRLAFDMDAWENPTVARALSHCAEALVEAGFAVELERWDMAEGKGLDDLLAAGKTPDLLQGEGALQAIRDIFATATADEEPAPPDELARLHDVLDSGGAEALFRDSKLLQALADLAGADPAGYAAYKASIRERVSLRDLEAALRPFHRTTQSVNPSTPTYFEEGGCICRNIQTKDGPVVVQLCNFVARIVEDVVRDDGAEQARSLTVEGTLTDGSPLPRAEVPAADFAAMNWTVPAWGTRAVVFAGLGTKDHLRAALQLLSGNVPRHIVYGHTGWRRIDNQWCYLHAGGAIGPAGLIGEIPMSLPEPLAGLCLPAPIDGAELVAAVRASLGFLRLGPDRTTFAILAAVYRSVLGETDFALHLTGPTGCFKSEVAALAQQHFGATLDARHLPANWSSTGNALEALAFIAKDALLVVDDFCPTGSATDVQRYHKEADRLFRGQGNRAGRQRMRADASLRPARPPRGLTLSTGEDTPRGQSLRARLLVLEISPGDFGPFSPEPNPALSGCQKDAAAGKYAASLAGFLRWLAPQYDGIRTRLRGEVAALRDQVRGDEQHARTPGLVADLALGLHYLLDFAQVAGAITETERVELWDRGWIALAEAGAAQVDHIATAEPAGLFLRLLSAAVAGGYAHFANKNGEEPTEPQRWGWRSEEFYTGNGTDIRYKPQGVRAGWIDDGDIYLEPEASFAAVQRFARDQNECFTVTANTLRRRLKEKGLLATTDVARGKLTVRRTLQGARRDVLHINWNSSASTPRTGPTGPENAADNEAGPEPRAGLWAGNGQVQGGTVHENAVDLQANTQVGRMGRSDTEEEKGTGTGSSDQQAGGWGDWQ